MSALALCAALGLSLSACGQPQTNEIEPPVEASQSAIPSAETSLSAPELSVESSNASSIASSIVKPDPVKPADDITIKATLYFVQNDKVVGVDDELNAKSLTPELVLKRLLEGPSEEQKAHSITTAIPEGTKLNGVEMQETVAVVDLSKEFESGGGTSSMRARIAQVVHTLGHLYGVEAVLFKIDGKEVSTFGSEGLTLQGPQTPDMWPLEL